jgi:uncharacterized protein (DUF2267 family)
MPTGLDVFDKTVQETNLWLKDVMARLGSDDRHLAYRALRATLHALRDRIGPQQAVHFAAQLPMLLRGLYFEGWRMDGSATKERHLETFLDHVAQEFPGVGGEAERVVRAVFKVVHAHVNPGEVNKLMEHLPKELRALWHQPTFNA